MAYNIKDLRKKMDIAIDASIALHKYMQLLEEKAYESDCVSEKIYYNIEANKTRKIANDLNNMYDDYAIVYYNRLYEVSDDIL